MVLKLVGAPFSLFRQLSVWRSIPWTEGPDLYIRALTTERSVMSGCGVGHEPAKNFGRKLWIKFFGLTPDRSGNASERRWD